MSHAIIRGKSGRRHEVDFEGCALRVEVHASDETVEIFVEADTDELPEGRRRFALINIPRHLFLCSAGAFHPEAPLDLFRDDDDGTPEASSWEPAILALPG